MITVPLRVVPVLVVAAMPLLAIKLLDIAGMLAAQAVQPAMAAPPSPAPPSSASPATPASAPATPPVAPGKAQAAGAQPAAAPPPPATQPAATQPSGGTDAAAPNAPAKPGARDPSSFSPAEIDLLQALSQRRAELDKRSDELDGREMMLKAAEQRIAEKIDALKKMEKSIDDLLQKKDEENEAKIKNIVKIYEIMKPQEAARIFEQLDMPVLLDVVEHMKEAKAAPILANMQPQKAKALTLALAERRQVPKP